MKKLIVFFVMLIPTFFSIEAHTLLISFTDGRSYSVDLNEYPVVTMTDETLKVTTARTAIEYDIQKVKDFKYVDNNGLIQTTINSGYSLVGNNLIIEALVEDTDAYVYNVNGVCLKSVHVTKGAKMNIDFNGWQSGIYIVKVNDSTIKINR